MKFKDILNEQIKFKDIILTSYPNNKQIEYVVSTETDYYIENKTRYRTISRKSGNRTDKTDVVNNTDEIINAIKNTGLKIKLNIIKEKNLTYIVFE